MRKFIMYSTALNVTKLWKINNFINNQCLICKRNTQFKYYSVCLKCNFNEDNTPKCTQDNYRTWNTISIVIVYIFIYKYYICYKNAAK